MTPAEIKLLITVATELANGVANLIHLLAESDGVEQNKAQLEAARKRTLEALKRLEDAVAS